MKKTQQQLDADIYRAYKDALKDKTPITKLVRVLGVSRTTIYDVVNRVENGNVPMIRKCLEKGRNECLWEHKYQAQFMSLPKDKKADTVAELRIMIRHMKSDGFPDTLIAKKLGLNRSTVEHHLGK